MKLGGGIHAINIDGSDAAAGFDGGFFVGITAVPYLTIQPELLITQKGMEYNYWLLGWDWAKYEWNFTYVEIPILAKFNPMPGSDFRPSLFIGPYVGFLSSAKAKWSVNPHLFGDDYDQERDIKEGFKNSEIGFCSGFGIDFKLGDMGLLVFDFRVEITLSDILDDRQYLVEEQDILLYGDQSMRHVNLFFTIGYAFEFSEKSPGR